MNLRSGKRILSNKWDELPITQNVFDRVHHFATKEKRPQMINKEMICEWVPGVPMAFHADNTHDNEQEHAEKDNRDEQIVADQDNDKIDELRRDQGDQNGNYVSDDESKENKYLKKLKVDLPEMEQENVERRVGFEEGDQRINFIPMNNSFI